MKIAIFTETYEPYVSGVTTSIKMLKEALEKMHHKVYIVTVNLKNYRFYYDKKNRLQRVGRNSVYPAHDHADDG